MSKDLPAEELEKVINNFIDNQEIKGVLVSNKVRLSTLCCRTTTKILASIKTGAISAIKETLYNNMIR